MATVAEILVKPVKQWTAQDLEDLCAGAAEEGQALEFKQDLSTPQGAKGWRLSAADSPAVHRNEAKELAREVVAFANASGGIIVVGIEESDDHPKRAVKLSNPLPRVFDLANRLEASFLGSIRPGVRGLQVAPISSGGAGEGYLAIAVPQSLTAPHGVGTPPECHWRRDASCVPMEMTDLHNAFWESRTRRERIEGEFLAARERFGNALANDNGFIFRLTAVSEAELSLRAIYRDWREGRIAPHSSSAPTLTAAEYPLWNLDAWKPTGTGAELYKLNAGGTYTNRSWTIWSIDEIGCVEVLALFGKDPGDGSIGASVSATQISATAMHLLWILEYISKYAGASAESWRVNGQIGSTHRVDYVDELFDRFGHRHHDDRSSVNFLGGRDFRPVPLKIGSTLGESFGWIEERIWMMMGLGPQRISRLRFQSIVQTESTRNP